MLPRQEYATMTVRAARKLRPISCVAIDVETSTSSHQPTWRPAKSMIKIMRRGVGKSSLSADDEKSRATCRYNAPCYCGLVVRWLADGWRSVRMDWDGATIFPFSSPVMGGGHVTDRTVHVTAPVQPSDAAHYSGLCCRRRKRSHPSCSEHLEVSAKSRRRALLSSASCSALPGRVFLISRKVPGPGGLGVVGGRGKQKTENRGGPAPEC